MNTINLIAFDIGTEDTKCYSSVMSAKALQKIATVSRADKNPENGYQRFLDSKRVKEIAGYIEQGNIIPGSIILSVQAGSQSTYDESSKELNIKLNEGESLFVIDGQHRLYGANMANKDVQLPVCIFIGLELKQEVQYFLDINSYQRGVSPTLRKELVKFLAEPDSKDAIRIRLFKELNEETASPLYNRLSSTASMPDKLTHVPFEAAIDPLLEGKILRKFSYGQKKTFIINYLSACEYILKKIEGDSSRITNSIFFEAIFKIFDDVCDLSLTYFKNYSEQSFIEILDVLTRLDFSRFKGSNNQVKNEMIREMQSLLEMKTKMLGVPDDDLLF